MTDKTEFLPCPFCNSSAMPGVAHAQCSNSACPAFHIKTTDIRMWNTRAAPAEDVRAAGDEPVGYAQTKDLEKISGRSVIHVGVLMGPKAQDGFEPLYRHPQRPVVLPERLTMKPFQTVDRGSTSYKTGYNACLDEFARLNP